MPWANQGLFSCRIRLLSPALEPKTTQVSSDSPEHGTFFSPFSLKYACSATLLVSAAQPRASATCVHASPLSLDRLPLWVSTEHGGELPTPCSRFSSPPALHRAVCSWQRQPPSSSHTASPVVSIHVFSKTASPFLLHMSHCLYQCGIQTPWHMTQPYKRMKLGHLQRHR